MLLRKRKPSVSLYCVSPRSPTPSRNNDARPHTGTPLARACPAMTKEAVAEGEGGRGGGYVVSGDVGRDVGGSGVAGEGYG